MGTSTTPLYFLSRFTEVRVNTALWGGVGGEEDRRRCGGEERWGRGRRRRSSGRGGGGGVGEEEEEQHLAVLHGEAGEGVVEGDVVPVAGDPVPVEGDARVYRQGGHLEEVSVRGR